eukprot:15453879-Alexandrium_andersonii.AAC.1
MAEGALAWGRGGSQPVSGQRRPRSHGNRSSRSRGERGDGWPQRRPPGGPDRAAAAGSVAPRAQGAHGRPEALVGPMAQCPVEQCVRCV